MVPHDGGYYDHPDLYDATASGVRGDIAFYRDLAVASGGPVIELGVGTGRIAIPTAVAGVQVIGIDLSPAMLAVARRRAADAGVEARLRLVEGDMRTFAVARPAPLVTIPFRAFLHNLTVEDQQATLDAAYGALAPGGRLALNVFNPDLGLITRWMGKGPRYVEPVDAAGRVEGHHDYEPTSQRVTTRLRWREGGRTRRAAYTVRYAFRTEMQALLEGAGFAIEALYGDCERGAFAETSTELVWIARRPT